MIQQLLNNREMLLMAAPLRCGYHTTQIHRLRLKVLI